MESVADKSVKYLIIVFFSRESTDKYLHKIKKKMANILSCFVFLKKKIKTFFFPSQKLHQRISLTIPIHFFPLFFFAKPV